MFKKSKKGILFQRLGPMSGQVQSGKFLRFEQDKKKGKSVAPVRKGIWAFPWPFFEMFYAAHNYEKLMPKKLINFPENSDDWAAWHEAREEWIKKFKQTSSAGKVRKIWHKGVVFSRFNGNGAIEWDDNWFYYENANLWVKEAKKHLIERNSWISGDTAFWCSVKKTGVKNPLCSLAADHLEVFLPIK